MRSSALIVEGLLLAASCSTVRAAQVVGLTVEKVNTSALGWDANGYEGLDTFRVYAQLDGPDFVLAVGDVFAGGDLLRIGSTVGEFHNGGLGNNGNAPPTDLTGAGSGPRFWAGQWDTYCTIGSTEGPSALYFAPGFEDWVEGMEENFVVDNNGWYIVPGDPNGETDENHRVLILQLTVPQGALVCGQDIVVVLSDGWDDATANFSAFELLDCPEDVDRSGEVGAEDLVQVLINWGHCGCCPEDLDHDGGTGFVDLAEILVNWGLCPAPGEEELGGPPLG